VLLYLPFFIDCCLHGHLERLIDRIVEQRNETMSRSNEKGRHLEIEIVPLSTERPVHELDSQRL